MKRLCLILAYLFLFTQTASAMPLLVGQKVVYRGTITGLRISAVNGTAFIDNAGATIPTYADGNHSIEIYDSSNRMLKGVLKAAGTGETLGADLLSGFDFTSGWEVRGESSIIDSNSFSTTGLGGGGVNKSVLSSLCLYKRAYEKSTTAYSSMFRISSPGGSTSPDDTDLETGSKYSTAIPNYLFCYARNSSAGTTDVTTFTVQQVLTPSSSGATIVSAKGGTTYNFSYKNASFTYNASSYYVIIRAIR